jgi:hypothetical protein
MVVHADRSESVGYFMSIFHHILVFHRVLHSMHDGKKIPLVHVSFAWKVVLNSLVLRRKGKPKKEPPFEEKNQVCLAKPISTMRMTGYREL